MSNGTPKAINKSQLRKMINLNADARQYFYSQAGEQWLDWLWTNGFLDEIKNKAEDSTRYGYTTPELHYLARMAVKAPEKVVTILLAVPISKDNFNPEVIDRFLGIGSELPAGQLSRLVEKIQKEHWVSLMNAFNHWEFWYAKMFATLAAAGDYGNLLVLANALLELKPKEKTEDASRRWQSEKFFYIDDLAHTKVFESLVKVDDKYVEDAFALVLGVMGGIVSLGNAAKPKNVFQIEDSFHLYDVDFFALTLGKEDDVSGRDDVHQLAAAIVLLARRLIGEKCGEPERVQEIYRKHIEPLPQSWAMWRLRLFLLSLCPGAFIEELDASLFRLFEVESYYEISSGTEYMRALKTAFPILPDNRKREFVRRVVERFSKKESEEGDYLQGHGSRILSMIYDGLVGEERAHAEQAGFQIDPTFQPTPSIGQTRGGFVSPRGPLTEAQFAQVAPRDIALKLRNEWTPQNLIKADVGGDFLNPLNAEGVGTLLKSDIPKRLQEYVDAADAFFQRGVLDQHYTYSFLRGIAEALKEHPDATSKTNWEGILNLAGTIKRAGEAEAFDRTKRGRDSHAWLVDWDGVHSALADVIRGFLAQKDGRIPLDFQKYRAQIFDLLAYLLAHPDPSPADEELETAKRKTKSPDDSDFRVSDPFTAAINSVRGRSFEVLMMFVHLDANQFKKDASVKISKDVRELYERVLGRENTRAIMFMFGHYLPQFYFRDKDWIRELMPRIFPSDAAAKDLYTAAWEGYLVNNLYKEMLFDTEIQKLYRRGLQLTEADYPRQKHFKEPDKSAAVHLSIAFMHYKEFDFDHPLFKMFWGKDKPDSHGEFVSFLGRSFVSGSNAKANKLLEEEPESKRRLRDLWDWLLKNYKDPHTFRVFGFWINLEKGIFEPAWLADRVNRTLAKTRGVVDWDRGLSESIVQLSKSAPQDSLAIARWHLLEGYIRGEGRKQFFSLDIEWTEALKILHDNPETRPGTIALINELIREGGSMFWSLKKIIEGGSQ